MNLTGYLFTVNKNNRFKLDQDELKDVLQDIQEYLLSKNYNDLLTKKTAITFYIRAVKKRIRSEETILSKCYLNNHDPGEHETEQRRMENLQKLSLNQVQTKIVKLLIAGYSYTEIRRKMQLNNNQLVNQVKRIKKNNSAGQTDPGTETRTTQ